MNLNDRVQNRQGRIGTAGPAAEAPPSPLPSRPGQSATQAPSPCACSWRHLCLPVGGDSRPEQRAQRVPKRDEAGDDVGSAVTRIAAERSPRIEMQTARIPDRIQAVELPRSGFVQR